MLRVVILTYSAASHARHGSRDVTEYSRAVAGHVSRCGDVEEDLTLRTGKGQAVVCVVVGEGDVFKVNIVDGRTPRELQTVSA